MRKYLLSFLAACSVFFVNAQNAIPNPGFETWNFNPNYDDPAGWGTINGLTYILGVRTVTKATAAGEVHSGTAAIKLESKTVPFQGVAPGIAATGTINPSTQAVDGGVAFNKRPISFTGWFRYEPNGVDTGSIDVRLSKWNSGTNLREDVGTAEFVQSATVNSYTQFTVNFNYTSANFPDTMVITILTSSGANASPVGTKMWVDDLALVLCAPNYAAATTTTNATCTASNGSATVTPSNGINPYSFNWSNNGTANQISNVPAGAYTVTVTDGNGCTVSSSAMVNANTNPLTVTTSATQSSCTGSTGSVTASATGGAQPYTYLWSGGGATSTVSNLGAGSYDVTITDSNGCSGTGTASVTTPNGPSATNTVTNVACYGGSGGAINVTVTGGSGAITYLWNDAVATEDRTGLSAGNYTLVITDANNCSFAVNAVVTEPDVLTVIETKTDVLCNGGNTGSVILDVAGGTGPYTYAWSSPQGGTNLTAGTYTVTITDANACTLPLSVTITEPSTLSITTTATNASAPNATDGSVSATATGGTAGYTYLWSNAVTVPNQTAVGPGVYCVTVTDNNSCSVSTCATVSAPSAIGDLSEDLIKIYPNPTSSQITIETNTDGKFSFAIYNVEGRLVEERNIDGSGSIIDLKHLANGLYTYQLTNTSSGKTSLGKLQIEK